MYVFTFTYLYGRVRDRETVCKDLLCCSPTADAMTCVICDCAFMRAGLFCFECQTLMNVVRNVRVCILNVWTERLLCVNVDLVLV